MARRRKQQDDEPKVPKSNTCIAAGCELPWTCTEATHCHGESTGFCRYHFGRPANRWNQITEYIDEHIELYRAAIALVDVAHFHKYPKDHEFPEFPILPDEGIGAYKRRLLLEFAERVDF